MISGAHGVFLSGKGNLKDFFIQARFIYLPTLWVFLGFTLIREHRQILFITRMVSILMMIKGIQGVIVYFLNKPVFVGAEYLIDHTASALLIAGLAFAVCEIINRENPIKLKLVYLIGFLPTVYSFILNDRRSAMVAIPLAMIPMALAMPTGWYRGKIKYIVALGAIGTLAVLPAAQSIISASEEGPSFRDIENFNLFKEATESWLTGIGYGVEAREFVPLPFIGHVYSRNQLIPHNTVLLVLAAAGPLGIAALGLTFSYLITLFGHYTRKYKSYNHISIGIFGQMLIGQWLIFTFADMSLQDLKLQAITCVMAGGIYRILQEEKTT